MEVAAVASLRRLNRRLLAWRRYAQRTAWNPRITRPVWMSLDTAMSPGHTRAWEAQQEERQRRADREERRFWAETPEVWLGGPDGEQALMHDVHGWPCRDCGLPDLHHGQGDGIGSCDCPRCPDCGAAPGDCDGHDDPCEEHGFQEAGLL